MNKGNSENKNNHRRWRQQRLPKELMNGGSTSQNVFIYRPEGDGRLSLYPSNHVGHQFFKSLVELNRSRFIQSFERKGTNLVATHIALSIVNNICNNNGNSGRIYFQGDDKVWLDMGHGPEAHKLVLETMKCMFHFKRKSSTEMSGSTTSPSSARGKGCMQSRSEQVKSGPREGSGDHLVRESGTAVARVVKRQRDCGRAITAIPAKKESNKRLKLSPIPTGTSLPLKKRVRFQPNPSSYAQAKRRSFEASIQAARTLTQLMNGKTGKPAKPVMKSSSLSPDKSIIVERSRCNLQSSRNTKQKVGTIFSAQEAKESMPLSVIHHASASRPIQSDRPLTTDDCKRSNAQNSIRATDILCGGKGHGILECSHPANCIFIQTVKLSLLQYVKLQDWELKIRFIELTVHLQLEGSFPKGRFLGCNRETGEWEQLSFRRAVGKALRTFQSYEKALVIGVVHQRSTISDSSEVERELERVFHHQHCPSGQARNKSCPSKPPRKVSRYDTNALDYNNSTAPANS